MKRIIATIITIVLLGSLSVSCMAQTAAQTGAKPTTKPPAKLDKQQSKLMAVAATAHSTLLSWGSPGTPCQGTQSYNIYSGPTAGSESSTPIATSISNTTYQDLAVSPGQTKFYVAKTFCSTSAAPGTSVASNEVSGTTPQNVDPAPGAPTGLTATPN